MNFQQLRAVHEAARRNFNLTEVAQALFTSQPGVSRQIGELESELGLSLFVRQGKRLTGLSEAGALLLPIIEQVLQHSVNLRSAAQDFSNRQEGPLSIAATHSQARYALPSAVRDFCAQWPQVKLSLHQGSPQQIAHMLIAGEADLGIATEALSQYRQLVTLPCYQWTHVAIVPPGHALLDAGPLTLAQLADYPLITYESGYTGRSHIDEAFTAAGLQPNIVLTAMDADVIKTYVELGMGVGIVALIAFDEERDRNLRAIDAGHLFELNVTRIAFRRDHFLRSYMLAFIQTFAPPLNAEVVRNAQQDAQQKPEGG